MKIAIISMTLCLLLSYIPPSPPALTPDDMPFLGYDPAKCPSSPISAFILQVGVLHEGNVKVYETEPVVVTMVDDVTVFEFPPVGEVVATGEGAIIDVNNVPYYDVPDPNDPAGRSRIYRYRWTWLPDANDIGIHYVNITVTDSVGNAQQRTAVIMVEENQAPVIGGCE